MPCYKPITAYKFAGVCHASGKPKLIFSQAQAEMYLAKGLDHEIVTLPCSNKCIGCLLTRAGEWAVRCIHESMFHMSASFLTLTYDRQHLPEHGTLVRKHFQDFMKRLRIHLVRNRNGTTVKFFMCGEYGALKGRPHYHVVLLGYDFPDKTPVPNNPGAPDVLYDSAELRALWKMGDVRVGTVTEASASYVARYTMKKLHGAQGDKEYEQAKKIPPYITVSQGFGARFFDKYRTDLYPSDFVLSGEDRHRVPVPRYYDKRLQSLQEKAAAVAALVGAFTGVTPEPPKFHDEVKALRRKKAAELNPADHTIQRLQQREECIRLKAKALIRHVDKKK